MAANNGEVRVGLWGVKGETEFNYQIKDGQRIAGFWICTNSERVYDLNLIIKSASPNQSVPPSGDVGVPSNAKWDRVIFDEDEYITGFSGTYASDQDGRIYVTSLSIITNKRTYGPYGKKCGTDFSLPVFKGKFVGCFGWKSDGISGLGAILKPE